ncbi:MAG: tetratricopeptide repeat protein [Phycisphaerales bacterium]|nr:tetratricopeptide repeat protein [Phycisphaerales bacterium]MCB9862482.1 tetratricopeptide repeat protein [Phycisphaerales bacterium]
MARAQRRQSRKSKRSEAASERRNAAATDIAVGSLDGGAAARSKIAAWMPLMLIVGGALAYSTSFKGVFLLDDIIRIRDNPYVQQPWYSGTWLGDKLRRPLVSLSLAINNDLGDTLAGYHAFNLAIHLFAALVLFGIIRRTLRLPRLRERFDQSADMLAFIIALLWTLHPLQTASVTYIIQRCESMMGMFYLLTLYLVIRGATSTRSKRWYAVAVFACICGMLCKAVMVTAPLMILLFDRIFLTESFRDALRRRWGLYIGLAVSLAFLADGGFMTNMLNAAAKLPTTAAAPPKGLGGIPPLMYAATQPGVILHYLRLALVPVGLCFDYWWPVATTPGRIIPPALLLGAIVFATLWAFRRKPAFGYLGLWLFVIIAPTSSVRSLQSVAFEHRMYLSLAGLIAIIVFAAHSLIEKAKANGSNAPARVGVALAMIAACALGIATFERNKLFHSELAMWEDVVAKAPDNPRVRSNLALSLAKKGRFDEAIVHLEHALALWPDYGEAHNNMSMALLRKNRPAEALAQAEEALRIWPGNPDAHVNKAGALLDLGDPDGAIQSYERVLELKPGYAAIRSDLGAAYAQKGMLDKAIEQYEIALDKNADDAMAINNLGGAYYDMGRLDDAIAKFRRAVEINDDYADAHHNLGLALKKQGNVEAALASYRRAIEINPDYADAHNNLGSALLANGDAAGAVAEFEAALHARSDFPIAHTNLGHARYFLAVAFEKAGKLDDAVKTYRAALEILPDHPQALARLNALLARDQVAAGAMQ